MNGVERWRQRAALQAVVLVAALLLFDWLVERRPFGPHLLWAPLDTFFHGVVALLILWPLVWGAPRKARGLLATGFLAASLIDLDHFLAAGSASLAVAVDLDCRPWPHSLAFVVLGALFARVVTRCGLLAVSVGVALASHVLRDAAGGGCTPWLWPLAPVQLPYGLYVPLTLLLGFGMALVARVWRSRMDTAAESTR